MARSALVTADSVAEAADQLLMAGQRPTIERMRDALGGGSPNTIGPHLNAWFEELGRRLRKESVLPSREAVPPAVIRLYEAVRTEVAAEAEQRIAAGVAAARLAAEHAERQAEMDRAALVTVEAELSNVRATATRLKEMCDGLYTTQASDREQIQVERRRIADLEAHLERARAEAERLKREFKGQLDEANQRADAANQRADDTTKRVLIELDAERVERKSAEKTSADLQQALERARAQAGEQKANAAEEAGRLRAELASSQQSASAAASALTEERERADSLSRQAAAAEVREEALAREIQALRNQLQDDRTARVSVAAPSKVARSRARRLKRAAPPKRSRV